MFVANDSITWPVCGGNRWRRKGGGGGCVSGSESGQAKRWPGWGRGEAGTMAVLGLDVGLQTREEAEESRCSLPLAPLTSSVTGSAS